MITTAFKFLKNKYLISSVLFLGWMAFFDPKDWGLISERKQKLKELEATEKKLTAQIAETREELDMLKKNMHTVEQFAREKYYWKKDNEDVFIVKTP